MSDLDLTVRLSGVGLATFGWSGSVRLPRALERAFRAAADDILAGEGLRASRSRFRPAIWPLDVQCLRRAFASKAYHAKLLEAAGRFLRRLCLFARLASDRGWRKSNGFSSVMNSALPKKRLIAHVLMRDAQDRVLLCRDTIQGRLGTSRAASSNRWSHLPRGRA